MTRKDFLDAMLRMATPVLDAASKGELRLRMAVEQKPGAGRDPYAALEALARLLCGMAPWLEADLTDPAEQKLQQELLAKARLAIAAQVDPESADFADYRTYNQPFCQLLVDSAFLAQAMLRAPKALMNGLPETVKEQVAELFRGVSRITPPICNWVLFTTEVEAALHHLNGTGHRGVIAQYFAMVDRWYYGDGWYGDGPHFALDYYNSLVIHPMLLDLCDFVPEFLPATAPETVLRRAQRHAELLEHLVAPDGSYIVTGRSVAYRSGVFHLLAQLASQKRLPDTLSPAAVREALFSIVDRTLSDASYREDGFLRVGVCGAQPGLGENYICTGSLYLASAVFLPLGLSPDDPFWTAPPEPWSQKAIWSGEDRLVEVALEKRKY